jgi:glycosyltransferase involved in cell wall biosynthesis
MFWQRVQADVDPRRFWRVARISLVPSLVAENQPLVAVEAMDNGVPVLGSDRGGIPETLGAAGSVLPLPSRLSPEPLTLSTPEEVAPWAEAILKLWDEPEVYASHSRTALSEAGRWSAETLGPLYERFFATVVPGLGYSRAEPWLS